MWMRRRNRHALTALPGGNFMWMRQTRAPRSGSFKRDMLFYAKPLLCFALRLRRRVMRIDPVRRQSVISLGSTLALTAIGFISTMFFAHTVGPAIT